MTKTFKLKLNLSSGYGYDFLGRPGRPALCESFVTSQLGACRLPERLNVTVTDRKRAGFTPAHLCAGRMMVDVDDRCRVLYPGANRALRKMFDTWEGFWFQIKAAK